MAIIIERGNGSKVDHSGEALVYLILLDGDHVLLFKVTEEALNQVLLSMRSEVLGDECRATHLGWGHHDDPMPIEVGSRRVPVEAPFAT